MAPLSEDLLRQAMQTPGAYERPPDPRAIIRAALRRRRRHRAVAGGVVAGLGALGPTWSALDDSSHVVMEPGALKAPGTLLSETPTTVVTPTGASPSAVSTARSTGPSAGTPVPPVVVAGPGQRVDLGAGWAVWADGTDVCTERPPHPEDPPEVGSSEECRSTSDGNMASGSMGTRKTGFFLRDGEAIYAVYGAYPIDAASVWIETTLDDGAYAQVVTFPEIPGWTFYFDREVFAPGLDTGQTTGSITAYDADGNEIASAPW